jgi:hypothetical protein
MIAIFWVFMRRQISSSTTLLYKILVGLVGLVLAFFLFSALFSVQYDGVGKGGLIASTLLMAAFFYVTFCRLTLYCRLVELDETNLYVEPANFWGSGQTVVPLKSVHQVRQNFLMRGNPEWVAIDFLIPNKYGTRIYFIPKTRFFPVFEHPIVEELNVAIIKAKLLP